MSEAWSQSAGYVVSGEFHLKQYLDGSERSAVFLADDLAQDLKSVAIKLIAADPASAELQLARWRQAQALLHPHLIRIFRSGSCQLGGRDVIFAVMEYAEENLAQILPSRALTSQETREMLQPTLDALVYLHGQGLVHGCLKPANVLAMNDQLKLASDSICRVNGTRSLPANLGVYDPPEMAGGGKKSQTADAWSLGMTLVEVLTQHLPFWNNEDQTDPVLPENLPAPFAEIVRGCLRRDPQSRLTLTDIAARLQAKPQPKPARVPVALPLPQKTAVSSRALPWVWRSAFPVVILMIGVVALLVGFRFLRHQQDTQPDTQPDVAAVKTEPKPLLPKPDPGRRASKSTSEQKNSDKRRESTPQPPAQEKAASLRSSAPDYDSDRSFDINSGNSGAGVGVVRQVLPNVPESASDTIQGTIRVSVRVQVDRSGDVIGADLDSTGPSKYFARLALEAAQRWKFVPSAQDAGRAFILRFEFRNDGSRAFAARAGT